MGAKQREKGDQFEISVCRPLSLWLVPKLTPKNYETCDAKLLPFRRRNPILVHAGQWGGAGDILHWPEVVCPFRVEAKSWEGWELDNFLAGGTVNVWAWWEQAKRQAEKPFVPLLLFKRNRKPAYAMMATGVSECLKLQPHDGSIVKFLRAGGEAVTVCLLSDLVRVPVSLVRKLKR